MPREQSIRNPFQDAPKRVGAPSFETLEEDARRDARQRRRTTWTMVVAGLAHVLVLWLSLPAATAEPAGQASQAPAYVLQPVRFQPPPPKQQRQVPKKKAKRVPIPDPTPDDPEPLEVEELDVELDLDFDEGVELVVDIPDAPPGANVHPGAVGAIHLGEGIAKPVKVHAPRPPYTEEARAARVQGTVVLQGVVTREGRLVDIRVLKGLPKGLSETAVTTMKEWLFEPATQNGLPVAVIYTFTVNFTLQ